MQFSQTLYTEKSILSRVNFRFSKLNFEETQKYPVWNCGNRKGETKRIIL
ncbi:hypothetical protein ARMA_0263 [Ardenticatena maritima]|uniref:Uncharacterized protein n=1 Tax=Ardenticatena maritima TaxID=872965 RepID=A0A0M9UBJ6_9CHLR|nr:hypothetical protein ARMA_0263 [Ardenticatena maritima]